MNRPPESTTAGALPRRRPARLALLAGLGAALVACTTLAPDGSGPAAPPAVAPGTPASLGMRDLRPEFRRAFCARLPGQADCADILLRLPGEPASMAGAGFDAPAVLAGRYRLAFVPGLLAGCAGTLAMPFTDIVGPLRAAGFDARILSIDGRGSTTHNADLIARQLVDAGPDPRPWIVFGYSKGLPDVLEALVRHPEVQRGIAAVISYAGAVGGSRLAEDQGGLSMALLNHVPLPGCGTGDGTDIQALRRDVRHAWWQDHHHELWPPLYVIAGAVRADRVSVPLRGSHAALSKAGNLNDGQLAVADALVPGGTLLAYVNADHWAMAIPLSSQLPGLRGLFVDEVPRADLALAAVQVVSRHTHAPHEQPHRP